MTIVDISDFLFTDGFANNYPFIYSVRPGGLSLASFWTNIFGVEDYSRSTSIDVTAFVRGFNIGYGQVDSYNALLLQQKTFYWDNSNQILYIHFEHDQEGWTDVYEYGTFIGFTDTDVVYINNTEHLPLIETFPGISQQQDLQDYDQLAFVTGSIELSNIEGLLDRFINDNIYGNFVSISYLPDDKIIDQQADAEDKIPLASLYVEDYGISLQNIDVRVQDRRKQDNITIPRDLFLITDYPDIGDLQDDVIPVMYGEVRQATAIPTNSDTTSGVSNFRVAILLTTLGTVQVNVDDVWTTVTPTITNLSTGEFTLSELDSRNDSGAIYECRVVNPVGIEITYTSDIIKDLYQRFLSVEFVESNFDISEWETEEKALSSGGWVFDEEIELFEAIRIIQNGSNVGFRFEINANGQRTIRIDDDNRESVRTVDNVEVLNRTTMPVDTDSDLVFAEIEIQYAKSFNSGKFLKSQNTDFSESVLSLYRNQQKYSTETILNNSTDAEARALYDANKYNTIPRILTLELMGEDFLDLRIYDILDLSVTPDFANFDKMTIDGREYFGFIRGKVISIDPDIQNRINTVELLLLGEIVDDGFDDNGYGLTGYGLGGYFG